MSRADRTFTVPTSQTFTYKNYVENRRNNYQPTAEQEEAEYRNDIEMESMMDVDMDQDISTQSRIQIGRSDMVSKPVQVDVHRLFPGQPSEPAPKCSTATAISTASTGQLMRPPPFVSSAIRSHLPVPHRNPPVPQSQLQAEIVARSASPDSDTRPREALIDEVTECSLIEDSISTESNFRSTRTQHHQRSRSNHQPIDSLRNDSNLLIPLPAPAAHAFSEFAINFGTGLEQYLQINYNNKILELKQQREEESLANFEAEMLELDKQIAEKEAIISMKREKRKVKESQLLAEKEKMKTEEKEMLLKATKLKAQTDQLVKEATDKLPKVNVFTKLLKGFKLDTVTKPGKSLCPEGKVVASADGKKAECEFWDCPAILEKEGE